MCNLCFSVQEHSLAIDNQADTADLAAEAHIAGFADRCKHADLHQDFAELPAGSGPFEPE
jgi:hypothetical protein